MKKTILSLSVAFMMAFCVIGLAACGKDKGILPEGTYKIQGAGTTVDRESIGETAYTYYGQNYAINADSSIVIGGDRAITLNKVGTHKDTGSTIKDKRYVINKNNPYTIESKITDSDEYSELLWTWNENGTLFNITAAFTYANNTIKLTLTYKLSTDDTKGWAQTFTFIKE
jgi:hypothetical protein